MAHQFQIQSPENFHTSVIVLVSQCETFRWFAITALYFINYAPSNFARMYITYVA